MELISLGRSGETLTNFCRVRMFISLDDFFSLPKHYLKAILLEKIIYSYNDSYYRLVNLLKLLLEEIV